MALKALGYDDRLGSIELGKTPGLVWLSGDKEDMNKEISEG
jgi:imidazolonepropionase-like amidohydrolase